MLKLNSQKDKIEILNRQLEGIEKLKTEYQKHYESAIIDMRNIDDCYKTRSIDLKSKCTLLEEKISSLLEMLNSSKQESFDWKIKYEEILCKKKIDDEKASAKTALFKSLSKTTELREADGDKKGQSAQKAAAEWKQKYENAVREAEAALEKATTLQECTNKQVLVREEGLRAEFSSKLAEKVGFSHSLALGDPNTLSGQPILVAVTLPGCGNGRNRKLRI